MELLFAYIDHYRTFYNQQISFSKRFDIEYDWKSNRLSINNPRKNYFNVYPNNISGITGVFGKNTSGKSSLLELIGRKIDDRWAFKEILKPKKDTPFEKFKLDIFKASRTDDEKFEYAAEYFLIYYYGQSEQDEPMFIFETDSPDKFLPAFANPEIFTGPDIAHKRKVDYFIGKGWLPFVFKIVKDRPVILQGIQTYEFDYPQCHTNSDSCIITFSRDLRTYETPDHYADEDSKIAVKRFYANLERNTIYENIKILFTGFRGLYSDYSVLKDDCYEINVKLADVYESEENKATVLKAIYDYRGNISDQIPDEQKFVLEFLRRYARYLAVRIQPFDSNEIISTLSESNATKMSYEATKQVYYRQVGTLFPQLVSSVSKDNAVKFLDSAVKEIEHFFVIARDNEIKHVFTNEGLNFFLPENFNVETLQRFFENVIDERIHASYQDRNSYFEGLVNADIKNLSTGIRESLSFYASLHEEISSIHPEIKNYILLFDEIERSMHPEMSRILIRYLLKFLSQEQYSEKRFQIIISSHSPFIAGDIREENIVCLEKTASSTNHYQTNAQNVEASPFGQNIHKILKSQFFLTNTFGAYATEVIYLIINFLKTESRETAVETLNDFYHRSYTADSREPFEFIQSLIDGIGEDIIRIQLQREYKKWLKQHPSV